MYDSALKEGLACVRRSKSVICSSRSRLIVTRPPTSSLVKVAGLVRPELLLEVEAVAAV